MRGKFNLVTLYYHAHGDTTGTGSAADLTLPRSFLPVKCKLVNIRASVTSADSGTTSVISVKNGSTTVGSVTLTTSVTTASAAPTDVNRIYQAGEEFTIAHQTTNAKNIVNLQVLLTFRQMEP